MANASTGTGYRIGQITDCMVCLHMIGSSTSTHICKYHARRGIDPIGAYEVGNGIGVC